MEPLPENEPEQPPVWTLVRDAAVLQVKLIVDGLRDLLLVPASLVAALGVGLATVIRGRNPLIDGFGLIAFASLTPLIFVMAYGIFGVGDNAQQLDGPIGQAFRALLADGERLIVLLLSPVGRLRVPRAPWAPRLTMNWR